MRVCRLIASIVGVTFLFAIPEQVLSASGAKAIFRDDGASFLAKPASVSSEGTKKSTPGGRGHLGVAYWIDLLGADGKTVRKTTSHVFQSGDRIKLVVQPNLDGYLYVLGFGTTGTSRVLFPNNANMSNQVKARETYTVPFNTAMKFDANPGEETLLLLLSQYQIPAYKPGLVNLAAAETQQVQQYAENQARGAKDLVLEEEEGDLSASPAQYVVVPISALGQEGSLSVTIKLKHR